jgi:DHA1 family tetracycline resistance protein-like MFS transporter
LLIVFLLFSIGTSVYAAIWPFFTLERFGWSPGMIGVSLTVYGLASALVQSVLIRPTIARIGERHTVTLGLATEIIALGLVASIANQWVVLALTPVAAFGSIATAAIRSLMSTAVDPQSQGQLQGVLSALMAVAMIVTPLAMSALFYAFSGPGAVIYFPGAPFLVSALLVVISLILFVRAYSNKPLP